MAGYVVEAALKSRIAKQTKRHDFPDKEFVQKSYTHKLTDLLKLAALEDQLRADATNDPQLEVNWGVVKDWSEQSRYEKHSRAAARDLFNAIHDPHHGALEWLRRHW